MFSFYKEQLHGESDNYISAVARVKGQSKVTTMEAVAQECIKLSEGMQKALEPFPEAGDILVRSVMVGYIHFHVAARLRYRLDELNLDALDM